MSDPFIPLALKYRPQRFADIIGQEVPVMVLRNSIKKGTIYPSLVFYGHFGSGKTTLARIYTKAINCESPEADGEPCCKCSTCKEIVSGSSTIYLEQDAASSGQVEHARQIGELISYKPLGKYRVVCLDEAHAATTAAWNAMLKYVEEPPPNVVFIFVSTEVAKIPDPILSRCFAIPFRGVAPHEVVSRLRMVVDAEKIAVESNDVLYSIVQRTGGAVRDALVMMDQARMVANGEVITLDTLRPLGFCDESVFIEFLSLWKEQKIDLMVALYRQWAPLVGPEAFLKGLEDMLYREILHSVGVEQGRSERRALLRLSMADLWQCIQRVWKVIDQAHIDLGRVEATLICTLLRLGDEPQPASCPTAPIPVEIPKSLVDAQVQHTPPPQGIVANPADLAKLLE